MYLFVDTISPSSTLILFENRNIVSKLDFVIKGKEYDNFLSALNNFLSSNNFGLDDIKGIVVINGPGGFTGTRIVALTINTINFTKNIPLLALDYFSLLEKNGLSYPMLIKANRGEYLLKENSFLEPMLVNIPEIANGDYSGIGDIIDFENRDISIKGVQDYNNFIKNNDFIFTNNRIEPYYIKKPSIS